MLRSLYSGISGMKVNQTKMDVIGNNISNVGTTAFKGGRVRFQDMLSQSSKGAMAPMPNTGGTNPSQVGLGVQVAGIDTLVTQGMMQPTGNPLDVAMDGDGYFMVGKGPETVSTTSPQITVDHTAGKHTVTSNANMNISYTRDGAFTLDSSGNLLTTDGYRVLGYSLNGLPAQTAAKAPTAGGLTFTFGTGSALNNYKIATTLTTSSASSTAATATLSTTGNIIRLSAGSHATTAMLQKALDKTLSAIKPSVTITLGGSLTSTGGSVSITGGTGGSLAPTCATTSIGTTSTTAGLRFVFGAGTELNGAVITTATSSSLTTPVVTVNSTTKAITMTASSTALQAGKLQSILDAALIAAGITQKITLSGGTTTGASTSAFIGGTTDKIVHSLDGTSAAPVVNFVDGSQDLAADDGMLKTLQIPDKVLISGTAGASDAVYSKVKTYAISKEGLITAVLDNDKVTVLGQIATATFKNPAGLSKMGKNVYQSSSNSGDPTLRVGVNTASTNEDNSKGYGDVSEGMLEMSNVDLAEQFTDMIITSRAFQASGKMITTGDEILQDIINLKR